LSEEEAAQGTFTVPKTGLHAGSLVFWSDDHWSCEACKGEDSGGAMSALLLPGTTVPKATVLRDEEGMDGVCRAVFSFFSGTSTRTPFLGTIDEDETADELLGRVGADVDLEPEVAKRLLSLRPACPMSGRPETIYRVKGDKETRYAVFKETYLPGVKLYLEGRFDEQEQWEKFPGLAPAMRRAIILPGDTERHPKAELRVLDDLEVRCEEGATDE
jgi:hypothetical protein